MNHPGLKSKPQSKETPTIQSAMQRNQSHDVPLTDLGLGMISIVIVDRVILIVNGEMLESSFQRLGGHGYFKKKDGRCCSSNSVVYTETNNCRRSSKYSIKSKLSIERERKECYLLRVSCMLRECLGEKRLERSMVCVYLARLRSVTIATVGPTDVPDNVPLRSWRGCNSLSYPAVGNDT